MNVILDQEYKDELLSHLSKAIKQVQMEQLTKEETSLNKNEVTFTNESPSGRILCSSLEMIFMHGLRLRQAGCWEVVRHFCHRDLIQQVEHLKNVKTNAGKGRAWIFISLNEKDLEGYLQSFQMDQSHMRKHYHGYAMMCGSQIAVVQTLISGLDYITFRLYPDVAHLDFGLFHTKSVQPLKPVGKTSCGVYVADPNRGSVVHIDTGDFTRLASTSSQKAVGFVKGILSHEDTVQSNETVRNIPLKVYSNAKSNQHFSTGDSIGLIANGCAVCSKKNALICLCPNSELSSNPSDSNQHEKFSIMNQHCGENSNSISNVQFNPQTSSVSSSYGQELKPVSMERFNPFNQIEIEDRESKEVDTVKRFDRKIIIKDTPIEVIRKPKRRRRRKVSESGSDASSMSEESPSNQEIITVQSINHNFEHITKNMEEEKLSPSCTTKLPHPLETQELILETTSNHVMKENKSTLEEIRYEASAKEKKDELLPSEKLPSYYSIQDSVTDHQETKISNNNNNNEEEGNSREEDDHKIEDTDKNIEETTEVSEYLTMTDDMSQDRTDLSSPNKSSLKVHADKINAEKQTKSLELFDDELHNEAALHPSACTTKDQLDISSEYSVFSSEYIAEKGDCSDVPSKNNIISLCDDMAQVSATKEESYSAQQEDELESPIEDYFAEVPISIEGEHMEGACSRDVNTTNLDSSKIILNSNMCIGPSQLDQVTEFLPSTKNQNVTSSSQLEEAGLNEESNAKEQNSADGKEVAKMKNFNSWNMEETFTKSEDTDDTYENIDLKSEEVGEISHRAITDIDNTLRLYLLLEILMDESENIIKLFHLSTGHSEGNWKPFYLLFSDSYIYFLTSGDGSCPYQVNHVVSYENLDYVSVGYNSQSLQFVFYQSKPATSTENQTQKTRTKLNFDTAECKLTNIVISTLTNAFSVFAKQRGVVKVCPAIFHDSKEHKISLQKCLKSEGLIGDIKLYHLVHWEDPNCISGANSSTVSLEGTLKYKVASFWGSSWKEGYFVLVGGVLYQYQTKESVKPDVSYSLKDNNCTGCKRVRTRSTPGLQFEVNFHDNKKLELCAQNDEEIIEWLQCLCLIVSLEQAGKSTQVDPAQEHDIPRDTLNSDALVPCSLMIADDHLLLCHEDNLTGFCRALAKISSFNIASVNVDNSSKRACEINIAKSNSTVIIKWTVYFSCTESLEDFMMAVNSYERAPTCGEISNASSLTHCKEAQILLDNRWTRANNLLRGR